MNLGPYTVPGFYTGDCRDLMRELPEGCVQCVVTSPPFWGLRVYAGEQSVEWDDGTACPFGNEDTPEAYVDHTVEILREVRRVLRDDGVCFWNVGDTYASPKKGNTQEGINTQAKRDILNAQELIKRTPKGMKVKDLCLIPYSVALAARTDGWFIRSIIAWHKTNPQPEGLGAPDRPWKSHEPIIMLSKSKRYKFRHPNPKEPVRDVWSLPLESYGGAHTAAFPRGLVSRCIEPTTDPGDVVLDPFFGSGTTGRVAEDLGRLWLGFDISEEYRELQKERTAQVSLTGALIGGAE